jgi:hypothetical protein
MCQTAANMDIQTRIKFINYGHAIYTNKIARKNFEKITLHEMNNFDSLDWALFSEMITNKEEYRKHIIFWIRFLSKLSEIPSNVKVNKIISDAKQCNIFKVKKFTRKKS